MNRVRLYLHRIFRLPAVTGVVPRAVRDPHPERVVPVDDAADPVPALVIPAQREGGAAA